VWVDSLEGKRFLIYVCYNQNDTVIRELDNLTFLNDELSYYVPALLIYLAPFLLSLSLRVLTKLYFLPLFFTFRDETQFAIILDTELSFNVGSTVKNERYILRPFFFFL